VREIVTPPNDATYTAVYAGLEYHLAIVATGGVNGQEPATFWSEPASADLWFLPSTDVRVTAQPVTGYGFLAWTGALAGQPDTASVTMSAPLFAGAAFDVIYSVPDATLVFAATVTQDVQLEVSDGTGPISWRLVGGALPAGITLSGSGRVRGAALETGSFAAEVEAVDANGLTGAATVTFEVAEPVIPIEQLVSPFLLSGPAMGQAQRDFLDRRGNRSGAYDIGDFRAWALAHPTLPLSATFRTAEGPATLVVPLRLDRSGGVGR
jgi:hypothetical protein